MCKANSRNEILGLFQWYRLASPETQINIRSVMYDNELNVLVVEVEDSTSGLIPFQAKLAGEFTRFFRFEPLTHRPLLVRKMNGAFYIEEVEKKYSLITRRLQEVLGGNIIKGILAEGRSPKAYLGTAPTGHPHIGYYVPLSMIADFLRAGVQVKILLAGPWYVDNTPTAKKTHAFLDNLKAPLDLVTHRTKYYEFVYVPSSPRSAYPRQS
ncbi:hypothetical protein JVT61DRAFT_6382 [Boletus reticuloceps]|uniref:SigF-like NTF2-like domain-containing protein n=1 Tax=Boletus reticuloceps TaxID=495285 RepID=A0A8I2YM66_9AGAM|nr:hypothetical protein JVT61DRAFT_6382 [Boletus reticuloceps]